MVTNVWFLVFLSEAPLPFVVSWGGVPPFGYAPDVADPGLVSCSRDIIMYYNLVWLRPGSYLNYKISPTELSELILCYMLGVTPPLLECRFCRL